MTLDRSRMRIMLVDDDTRLLTAVRRVLIDDGYQVAAISNPLTACRVLKRKSLDLVLSDIQMPEMDGLALMKVARAEQPGATRILVTGAATMDVVTQAINEGEVHRFLHKPFDINKLRKIVASALERHDEIRQASLAGRRAESHRQLCERIEQQNPGILHVERDQAGAYVLDEHRVRLALRQRELIAAEDEQAFLSWTRSWLQEPSESSEPRGTAILWGGIAGREA